MTSAKFMKLACAVPMLALLTSSCATKTKTGAAAGGGGGALIGAGIGALVGGKKGALVGAGVGAAAGATTGALIGRYMDKQEKELQKVKNAKVEREGNKLVVKFNSAILFDTNKADLKGAAKSDLAEFANVLKEYKDTDLIIEGHTDNTGTKKINKPLSVNRADSVIGFLESQGVDRSRMTGRGYADEMPVADNSSEAGRQQNRRVQIHIAANEKLQQEDAAAAQAQAPQQQ
jgi:outer membrane protein OmpA-like peptidoglycan-associated protein